MREENEMVLSNTDSISSSDIVGSIIAFESGELGYDDTVKLFSSLVKSGKAWQLQGFYGRTANRMIEDGILSRTGEIL